MKRPYVVLVLTAICIITSKQAPASSWEEWLPKLAERVQIWTLRGQAISPYFTEQLAVAYKIPDYCIDDFPRSEITINRENSDGSTGIQLSFKDSLGVDHGQFWRFSDARTAEWKDLGLVPKHNTLSTRTRSLVSMRLQQCSFGHACDQLRKLGVKLLIEERPETDTRRNLWVKNQTIRQAIGLIMCQWNMEAWQSGTGYIVLRNPLRKGMSESEAKASLSAAIERECNRHRQSTIDETGPTIDLVGRLKLAAERLPDHTGSWKLSDLSRKDRDEWRYLSAKGKQVRQISKLSYICRTLNGVNR